MRLPLLRCTGWFCGIALAAALAAPSPAATLITSAIACHVIDGPKEALTREVTGVSTFVQVTSPQVVACPLARIIGSSGTAASAFYFSGDNLNGAATFCTISSLDASGNLLSGESFVTTDEFYTVRIDMNANQMSPSGHMTLSCLLPPRGEGELIGTRVVEAGG